MTGEGVSQKLDVVDQLPVVLRMEETTLVSVSLTRSKRVGFCVGGSSRRVRRLDPGARDPSNLRRTRPPTRSGKFNVDVTGSL